jgi:hypothetical protein
MQRLSSLRPHIFYMGQAKLAVMGLERQLGIMQGQTRAQPGHRPMALVCKFFKIFLNLYYFN